MKDLKRWAIMNRVAIVILATMLFFAFMDAKQIIPFHTINTAEGWDLYTSYTGPAIWSMWFLVIGMFGVIWYLIFKDKSEALALSLMGWILGWFGTQDLFYFVFSSQTFAGITEAGCWADAMIVVRTVSNILGEACPTATSFILSGVLGIFVAGFVYVKLQRMR